MSTTRALTVEIDGDPPSGSSYAALVLGPGQTAAVRGTEPDSLHVRAWSMTAHPIGPVVDLTKLWTEVFNGRQ